MEDTLLAQTQALIAALCKECSHLQEIADTCSSGASYRPHAEEWSTKEVVGHIGDGLELMTADIIRIVEGTAGMLRRYDEVQIVRERNHQYQPFSLLIERATSLHQELIRLLQRLPASSWEARADHEQWGSVSVLRIVQLLVMHDRTHIAQIQQLHRYWQDGK